MAWHQQWSLLVTTPTATILFMASSFSESLLLSSISLRSSCLHHNVGGNPNFHFQPFLTIFSLFFFLLLFVLLPACHQAGNPALRHSIFMGTGVGLQLGERGAGGTGAMLVPSSVPILGTGTRTPSQPSRGCHPRMSPDPFLGSRRPSPAPSRPPAQLGCVPLVPSWARWHRYASVPRCRALPHSPP